MDTDPDTVPPTVREMTGFPQRGRWAIQADSRWTVSNRGDTNKD